MRKLSASQVFVCAFLFGIFVAAKIVDEKWWIIVFSFVVALFCGWKYFFGNNFWKKLVVFLIGILFGTFRFMISIQIDDQDYSNMLGKVVLHGCIEMTDVRSDKVQYTFDINEMKNGDNFQKISGKTLIFAKKYPLYEYGDCLEISGEIANPTQTQGFDYPKYLARYGIYKVMYEPSIKLLENKEGDFFMAYIYKLKELFERRMSEIFVEPYNSFMAGLLTGSRRGLPDYLVQDFKLTGLSHIMAISGYNITLVIMVIGWIFWFLRRKLRVLASVTFIVFFVVFTGMSASVVRAAVMGSVGLFALGMGRRYYAFWGLLLSMFVMNLWNPKILLYDVGFQLSALATFGLICVSPLIKNRFLWVPLSFGIREVVTMSLSAQITTMPVIISNFGQISVVCIFANLFVLPLIPFAMLVGFFAVCLSFFSGFLGSVFGFAGYLILKLIIFFVEFFASLPITTLHV